MSIPTATATMLAFYGYVTYKQYQNKEKKVRSEIRAEPDKMAELHESYCLSIMKKAMRQVISNNYDIFICSDYARKDPALTPTVEIIPPRKIVINYKFYNMDPEACTFVVRSAIAYHEWTQNHPINKFLMLSTSQIAIGIFAHYKKFSFLNTVVLSSLINIPLYLISGSSEPKKWHKKLLEESTDQELLGGQRFFDVLVHNCRNTTPKLKSCIKEIDHLIQVRQVYFNSREEKRRLDLLHDYLKPFCNQIVEFEFTQPKTNK